MEGLFAHLAHYVLLVQLVADIGGDVIQSRSARRLAGDLESVNFSGKFGGHRDNDVTADQRQSMLGVDFDINHESGSAVNYGSSMAFAVVGHFDVRAAGGFESYAVRHFILSAPHPGRRRLQSISIAWLSVYAESVHMQAAKRPFVGFAHTSGAVLPMSL